MSKPDEKKAGEWEKRIEDWWKNGVNAWIWCRENSLTYSQFIYWRQRLGLGPKKSVVELINSSLPSGRQIYLFSAPSDMRKGFEGLSRLVDEVSPVELISGNYFAFINRLLNKMKVIYWNENGLAVWYTRMERGTISLNQIEKLTPKNEHFIKLE